MNLALFASPSVRLSQDLKIGSSVFFQIVYMKLFIHKVRKVMKPDFWKKKKKKSPDVIRVRKIRKMTRKWGFAGFDKNLIH